MRLIARRNVEAFWTTHPTTRVPLERWCDIVRAATWTTMSDVQAAFPKAKTLNAERVRFEVKHNEYRMIAALDFARQIVFVKFIGTHKQYDAIDPFTVSLY